MLNIRMLAVHLFFRFYLEAAYNGSDLFIAKLNYMTALKEMCNKTTEQQSRGSWEIVVR